MPAHVKSAEQPKRKIPVIAGDTPLRRSTVAVIGAGTMGGGIAMALANIGIPVTLIDANPRGWSAASTHEATTTTAASRAASWTRSREGRAPGADHGLAAIADVNGGRHGDRGRVRRHGPQAGHLP